MNIAKSIMTVIAAVTAFSSCINKGGEWENIFVNNEDDISLTIAGQKVFSYNPNTCQIGYNAGNRQYRVSDDNMSDFFILTVKKIPEEEGEMIYSTIYYTTRDRIKTENMDLKVVKKDNDGKIWLWNSSKKCGVVIKLFE